MSTDALLDSASRLDEVMKSDAKFFRRRPRRQLRLRRAYFVEAEALPQLPDGQRWFAVVAQLKPGIRARRFICASASLDTDLSDSQIEMLTVGL
jgi:hypothetical protein